MGTSSGQKLMVRRQPQGIGDHCDYVFTGRQHHLAKRILQIRYEGTRCPVVGDVAEFSSHTIVGFHKHVAFIHGEDQRRRGVRQFAEISLAN
jgi:hypothetical protein